jgi:hypothetical protein
VSACGLLSTSSKIASNRPGAIDSPTSPSTISTRGSARAAAASGPTTVRFHSTSASEISATTTWARGPTIASAAPSV